MKKGKNFFWSIKDSCEVINKLKSRGFHATSLATYDFCDFLRLQFPFLFIPYDLAVRLRNSNKDKTSKSSIFEILPSCYILSLNPSGIGVCRSLIHFNSVSCLLIIFNLLVEFAS